MSKIKGLFLGLALLLLAIAIDRGLDATEYATLIKGETGPSGRSPSTHVQRLFSRRVKMKYLKWYIVAVLLIIATVMMTCCTAPYTAVLYKDLGGAYGETDCDVNGIPVIFLSTKDSVGLDVQLVLAHEEEHVRRARAFRGGCRALVRKYNTDRTYMLDEEAAAYCAETKVYMARGSTPRQAFDKVLYELLNAPAAKSWKSEDVEKHLPCHWLKFVQVATLDSTGRGYVH